MRFDNSWIRTVVLLWAPLLFTEIPAHAENPAYGSSVSQPESVKKGLSRLIKAGADQDFNGLSPLVLVLDLHAEINGPRNPMHNSDQQTLKRFGSHPGRGVGSGFEDSLWLLGREGTLLEDSSPLPVQGLVQHSRGSLSLVASRDESR